MKIDRLISLIMILLERRKVPAPELAEMCGVSTRTIYRDLEVIERAGIPVVTYPGLNGGVGIMDSYKMEKRLFSTADVTTLLMGLGSIRSSLSGTEVANALAKLRGLIPEDQRNEIELRAGRVSVDMSPWTGHGLRRDYFDLIQQAMEGGRLVEFAYRDRKLRRSLRRVEPYRLLLKQMSWYLEAWCLERDACRLFKLNRISDLSLLDELFKPRPEALQGREAAFRPEHDIPVTLQVGEGALDKLTDLFGWEAFSPLENGTWLAQVQIPPDELGLNFLLSLGADCVCLQPESVRREMRLRLERLAEKYRDFGAI